MQHHEYFTFDLFSRKIYIYIYSAIHIQCIQFKLTTDISILYIHYARISKIQVSAEFNFSVSSLGFGRLTLIVGFEVIFFNWKKKRNFTLFWANISQTKKKKKDNYIFKKTKNLISFDVLLTDSAKVLPETADNGIICFHFIVLLLLLESSI